MTSSSKAQLFIAARLKEARALAGLSQAQAAKVLNIHRPSMSEIEAGRRRVSAEELRLLCDAYDVDTAWVLGTSVEKIETTDPRVQLAARELAKVSPEDLERLLRMLAAMKKDNSGSK